MQKKSEAIRTEMLEKPMGRLLLKKSYPTVIIQLISIIYNTADTYFVAKINTESAAAVGVVFSLMSIMQAVGFGIGMGANSVISRSLGAQNKKKANIYGSTAVFFAILLGTLLMIFGLFHLKSIMKLIGASQTVLPYSVSYARYILIAAPFMYIYTIFGIKGKIQLNLDSYGVRMEPEREGALCRSLSIRVFI